jgi:hypothetical protein
MTNLSMGTIFSSLPSQEIWSFTRVQLVLHPAVCAVPASQCSHDVSNRALLRNGVGGMHMTAPLDTVQVGRQ